jgi:nucleoside-diphosphate-sugar epimerase
MRVLVTGGTGFIGINVVRFLAERGDDVVVLYRSSPDQEAVGFLADVEDRVSLVRGDVEDRQGLTELVRDRQIEVVVHGAAMTPTLETEQKMPLKIMQVNFMGTLHALEAARANDVSRFVYVSSNGVYGAVEDPTESVTEDARLAAKNLYGVAKIASEGVCRRYRMLYDMKVVSGRVCATYGPMERPSGSRKGMSAVYEAAHAALQGRKLRASGLSVARSWTHVEDIARGLIGILKTPHCSYDAYNVSYGEAYTLRQVLEAVKDINPSFEYAVVEGGMAADVAYDESRQRGPMDITRLREDVGYDPQYDLALGLQAYMNWLDSQY